MNTMNKLILAAFAATAMIPATVMAQSQPTKNYGFLTEVPGSSIVKSTNGLCWHDSDWKAGSADACNPAVPVAAAAPEPVIVAVAQTEAKPAPQKLSLSGDALFAFDKAVLKPEGKTMLDEMAQKLEGSTYDSIAVTGHTDRFGSHHYNQELSERRAQTVKEYLISKNIQAGRMDVTGKGETQPVTNAADCRGAKTAKVIACLQPDRRVDIEMTGTKTITSAL